MMAFHVPFPATPYDCGGVFEIARTSGPVPAERLWVWHASCTRRDDKVPCAHIDALGFMARLYCRSPAVRFRYIALHIFGPDDCDPFGKPVERAVAKLTSDATWRVVCPSSPLHGLKVDRLTFWAGSLPETTRLQLWVADPEPLS